VVDVEEPLICVRSVKLCPDDGAIRLVLSCSDFTFIFARIMVVFSSFFPKLDRDNAFEMFYLCFMTRACAGDEKSGRM